ncbi:hypothetical protein WMF26_00310 [Sorangium sp. So ce185]|uniref:hypothetical protein n=1 Tax=Sorangium sp. So ce185 TaxID=3133287 RepID=UPI003F6052D1
MKKKKKTQRRKDAKTQKRDSKKILSRLFAFAPLRLCAFAPLRLCAFAPLRSFFQAFFGRPRSRHTARSSAPGAEPLANVAHPASAEALQSKALNRMSFRMADNAVEKIRCGPNLHSGPLHRSSTLLASPSARSASPPPSEVDTPR